MPRDPRAKGGFCGGCRLGGSGSSGDEAGAGTNAEVQNTPARTRVSYVIVLEQLNVSA